MRRYDCGLATSLSPLRARSGASLSGPPELGAYDKGVVEGFGVSFNLPTEDFVRRPHPFNGTTVGKQAHEANHGEACRKSHAGLSTCRQLWGFNLNSHEQDNSKKSRYKSSLNNMTLGRFSFFATLFSELRIRVCTVGPWTGSLEVVTIIVVTAVAAWHRCGCVGDVFAVIL